MDEHKDRTLEALSEHLIEHGPDDITTVFGRAFELAMRIERVWLHLCERFLSPRVLDSAEAVLGAWLATPGCAWSLSRTASARSAPIPWIGKVSS